MPLYKFKCEKCDQTTEKLVSVTVEAVMCVCGGNAVKQFNTEVAFTIPAYMRADISPQLERHRDYMKNDSTVKEKVGSGEWAIEKGEQ